MYCDAEHPNEVFANPARPADTQSVACSFGVRRLVASFYSDQCVLGQRGFGSGRRKKQSGDELPHSKAHYTATTVGVVVSALDVTIDWDSHLSQ